MPSVNMNSLMAARNAILNRNDALQEIANKNARVGNAPAVKETEPANGFASQLTDALQEVNVLQADAKAATNAYHMGETNDVAAVMLAKHKASIGFESTLQVRNKLLSAYQDIMKMQV